MYALSRYCIRDFCFVFAIYIDLRHIMRRMESITSAQTIMPRNIYLGPQLSCVALPVITSGLANA